MKLSTSLILFAGLTCATSSYADHKRNNAQFEGRYYHSSDNGHYRHVDKHHRDQTVYYVRDDHHDYDHDRYYVRHVHTRDCGHHHEPAFNTRVKIFLGI